MVRETVGVSAAPSNGVGLPLHPRYVFNVSHLRFILILCAATSVNVERLFSRGRLVLSHTRSRLSVTSTRALLCLGSWSLMGLVKDEDVTAVAGMDEVEGRIELERLGEMLEHKYYV